MVALKIPIDAHSNITLLREITCWARNFWHLLYIPALSKWDPRVRFYDFLPVTLWIKKTTISVFTSFSRTFISEKKTLSLYTVIANLCQLIYKCPQTLQKMRLHIQSDRDTLETSLWKQRVVKAFRDMNEVEYDSGKYTNPYVSGLCVNILHFI